MSKKKLTDIYVSKIGLALGVSLYGYFCYLAFKGVDAHTYIKNIHPDILSASGLIGIYAYLYARAMVGASITVACICFLLFLIHVKKGGVDFSPFKDIGRMQDRTFLNLFKMFFLFYLFWHPRHSYD